MTWVVLQDVSMDDFLELTKHAQPWRKRVRDWWSKATTGNRQKQGTIPLFLLTPIHVSVENLGALYDKETKVALPLGTEPKTPFVLFYSVPLETGWGGPIHILGIALTDKLLDPSHAKGMDGRAKECRIGDLLQTHEYALDPVDRLKWLGSTSRDYWFRFCFSLSPAILDSTKDDDETAVTIDHIKYRAQLADVFWTNRQDKNFLDRPVQVNGVTKQSGDGYEMLRQLHESDSPYFDLSTPAGRTCDLISYWMLALSAAIAPKESQQKKKRAHFERELLRFRIERYFFLERHFHLLLQKNGLIPTTEETDPRENKDVLLIDDPGEREKQLYCMRLPGGTITTPALIEEDEYPNLWMSVPETHAGKEVVGSAMYDVDEGRVILTYRDMFQWAWTRMDTEFRTVTARMLEERTERVARVLSDEKAKHVHMMLAHMHSAASREDARDNAALEALRLARLGDMGVSGGADGLSLARVKQTFPPCMGRIVKDAFVHKTHPKHRSRVALVKFLLEAGYGVEDVDKLIYDMYEADRDYVYNQHDGRWDQEAYNSVFKG
jgi:hypothetical protein